MMHKDIKVQAFPSTNSCFPVSKLLSFRVKNSLLSTIRNHCTTTCGQCSIRINLDINIQHTYVVRVRVCASTCRKKQSNSGADRDSDGSGGTISRHWSIQPRQSMAIFRFLKFISKNRRDFIKVKS